MHVHELLVFLFFANALLVFLNKKFYMKYNGFRLFFCQVYKGLSRCNL